MVSANRPSLTVSDTPVLNRMQLNQQVTSNLNWTEEIGQLMSRLPDQDPTTPEVYISIDAEVLTSTPLTDKEIVASVQRTGIDDSEDEEEETYESACVPNILPSSAMQAVACLRNFVLQQQNSQDMLRHINRLEIFVEDVTTNSHRQATITEFFTKKCLAPLLF
ncbi:hypothetical protein PoB_002760500 [Plakobranchus ocellatus]|uniref:Uncharacterized protein n=1 Tax=Plakobranchus ocellatus TaxID=259542 RepID=A0AAV4A120_9GAST|nr:hypothetical protein PoB_002760500 [Plakobranchus ocellatus]